jgi:hypothetical protein
MIPFFPFIYEKKQEKKKEPLPLYVEEAPYNDLYEEESKEYQRVIIIDIM